MAFVGEDGMPVCFRYPTRGRVDLQRRRGDQNDIDSLVHALCIRLRNPLAGDVPYSKTLRRLPTFFLIEIGIGFRSLTEMFVVQGVEPGDDERRVKNDKETKISVVIGFRRRFLFNSRSEPENEVDGLISLLLD